MPGPQLSMSASSGVVLISTRSVAKIGFTKMNAAILDFQKLTNLLKFSE